MGIGDNRYTLLEVVNEVQRRLGLSATQSLSTNKLSIMMVDFINDICDELSDLGQWQEMLVSANISAVPGQRDYFINTSAQVKNIGDIFFSTNTGPLKNVTIRDMRIMTRVSSNGIPTQFTVFGTDVNGNPNIRVRPTPSSAQSGGFFSLTYYIRTPKYTTADGATLIPFPGNIVVNGVLAMQALNESGGSQTDHYAKLQQDYLESRKEALNRFNGDTGWIIDFTPSMQSRWRR